MDGKLACNSFDRPIGRATIGKDQFHRKKHIPVFSNPRSSPACSVAGPVCDSSGGVFPRRQVFAE
jgi:hypothetical protein